MHLRRQVLQTSLVQKQSIGSSQKGEVQIRIAIGGAYFINDVLCSRKCQFYACN